MSLSARPDRDFAADQSPDLLTRLSMASDVYFYVMEAGESARDLRKMVMVR